jgi:hypothetical protein
MQRIITKALCFLMHVGEVIHIPSFVCDGGEREREREKKKKKKEEEEEREQKRRRRRRRGRRRRRKRRRKQRQRQKVKGKEREPKEHSRLCSRMLELSPVSLLNLFLTHSLMHGNP